MLPHFGLNNLRERMLNLCSQTLISNPLPKLWQNDALDLENAMDGALGCDGAHQ